MKYNSLTYAVGAKIFDRFIKNSFFINKEYEKRAKDKTNVSDRERWVDKTLFIFYINQITGVITV